MNKKIVVTHDLNLSPKQRKRLDVLGDVFYYKKPIKKTLDWLQLTEGADVICSRKFGLEQCYDKLKNVVISCPFVDISWAQKKILNKNNITLLNSPGCNKHAVSEWIVGMLLNMLRELHTSINNEKLVRDKQTTGLKNKNILILGKGNIGTRVGDICTALEMNVDYFIRDENLNEKIKNNDIIVNCLSTNPSTIKLLDSKFFQSIKPGSYFISVTNREIYDPQALIDALDSNQLKKAALDAAGIKSGDTNDPYYQKLKKHPKILATAHIAARTDVTAKIANDMMIQNIEDIF